MTFSVAPQSALRQSSQPPAAASANLPSSGDKPPVADAKRASSVTGLPLAPASGQASALARCTHCSSRRNGICSSLDDAILAGLAVVTRKGDLLSGRVVMHEGDAADTVYTVLSGMLKLYKSLPDGRQQITGFATAGDVIGLAIGELYAYSAETVSPVSLCRIPTADLRRILGKSPALQARLLTLTSVELSAAQDQILLLGCKTAVERVASFLLALAARARTGAIHLADSGQVTQAEGDDAPVVFLPMTKADIGAYLGLRPETLSRVFRKLEDAGSIRRVSKDRIRLDDIAALQALATIAS